MKRLNKLTPFISLLEPRILFDGAAVTTAVDVLDNSSFENDTQEMVSASETPQEKKEVIFIDSKIQNYQDIIKDLDSNANIYCRDELKSLSLNLFAIFLETKMAFASECLII